MKKAVLGLAVVVIAYACGDAATNEMGEAFEDMGDDIADMGDDIADMGRDMQDTGDADAQDPNDDPGSSDSDQPKQSRSVTCDQEATYNDNPWLKYTVVDVAGSTFPDVTVRVVMPSFEANWCPGGQCEGLPSGKMISEYHVSVFTEDGMAFINCSGSEESITVFY